MQVGGDSQNTTPVAIQAGLQARQIVKAGADAVEQAAPKMSLDALKTMAKQVPGRTVANMPLADALQQQSIFTRLAGKLPFVKNFLGPDFILNDAIGGLGKEAVGELSKTQITKIMLEGGDDIAKKLAAGGVPEETIKLLTTKAAERAAALGGKAVQQAASSAVSAAAGMSDDALKAILAGAKNGGTLAGKTVTTEAIQSVIAQGGDDVVGALRQIGLRADTAKAIAGEAAKAAGKSAATTAVETGAQTAAKGGLKGFFGKLLSGAKGNFVVAAVFSIGSNAIQLATGKMNLKQFAALSAMDTGAYGAIGLGSAAAGAAIGSVVPVAGTIVGFVAGLAIGMVGGMIYEKVLRDPVKNMLGPSGGSYDPGAPQQQGLAPGEYADPYAQQPAQTVPTAPTYVDPYAQPGAQPAAPAPATVPGQAMSYEEALRYLGG